MLFKADENRLFKKVIFGELAHCMGKKTNAESLSYTRYDSFPPKCVNFYLLSAHSPPAAVPPYTHVNGG